MGCSPWGHTESDTPGRLTFPVSPSPRLHPHARAGVLGAGTQQRQGVPTLLGPERDSTGAPLPRRPGGSLSPDPAQQPPHEADSGGALSSAGLCGLAWPGPTRSLASLQGHWDWRPPGTHGNMNNKFRFFFPVLQPGDRLSNGLTAQRGGGLALSGEWGFPRHAHTPCLPPRTPSSGSLWP